MSTTNATDLTSCEYRALSGHILNHSGSDICTCRPYLIYGIEEAIRCAQRGGVGLIVYFRKEGRALGEVTKCEPIRNGTWLTPQTWCTTRASGAAILRTGISRPQR